MWPETFDSTRRFQHSSLRARITSYPFALNAARNANRLRTPHLHFVERRIAVLKARASRLHFKRAAQTRAQHDAWPCEGRACNLSLNA